jgi:hypothetical protein
MTDLLAPQPIFAGVVKIFVTGSGPTLRFHAARFDTCYDLMKGITFCNWRNAPAEATLAEAEAHFGPESDGKRVSDIPPAIAAMFGKARRYRKNPT